MVQEPQEESVEPPKKKVKALAGLTEAAEQSSDEEADLLLPVNDQMEEYKSLDDEEIMVPRGPKALGTVSMSSNNLAQVATCCWMPSRYIHPCLGFYTNPNILSISLEACQT